MSRKSFMQSEAEIWCHKYKVMVYDFTCDNVITLPMHPSPPGCRVYPGEQIHMYVPIRFLQVMPLLAQSSMPSSHSFWSGGKTAHWEVRGRRSVKKSMHVQQLDQWCNTDTNTHCSTSEFNPTTQSNPELCSANRHVAGELVVCLEL